MSKDKGSPKEAAIAKRRLYAMCDEHGITVASVERGDFRAATPIGSPRSTGFPPGFGGGPSNFDDSRWQGVEVDGFIFDEETPPPTRDEILEEMIRNTTNTIMDKISEEIIKEIFKKQS